MDVVKIVESDSQEFLTDLTELTPFCYLGGHSAHEGTLGLISDERTKLIRQFGVVQFSILSTHRPIHVEQFLAIIEV